MLGPLPPIRDLNIACVSPTCVAYLARCLVSHLRTKQPNLKMTTDVSCVELTALCHDLANGPWSHVWDGIFVPMAM